MPVFGTYSTAPRLTDPPARDVPRAVVTKRRAKSRSARAARRHNRK